MGNKVIGGILAALVLALALSFSLVPAVPAAAATINVPGDYPTIQEAINAASSGDTILVAAGVYTEPQLSITKSLTIQGAGQDDVIIQRSTGTSYFLSVSGAIDFTMKNLTIDASGSYTTNFVAHISGLNSAIFENVTVKGQGKNYTTDGQPYRYVDPTDNNIVGGLDLNGVNSASLTNVTVMNVSRNGLSFTNVNNISLSNFTTTDCGHSDSTGWAGLAIYRTDGGTSALALSGTNSISNSPIGVNIYNILGTVNLPTTGGINISNAPLPVSAPNTPNSDNFALNVTNAPYKVYATSGPSSGFAGYFFTTGDAIAAAVAAKSQLGVEHVVYDLADPKFIVGVGMSIQAAINAASPGDTINVLAGTYVEQVEVTKNLTLQGVGSGTIIQSPDVLTKYFTTGSNNNKPVVYVHDAADVTIQNLVVDGAGKGNANYRFIGIGYHNAGGKVDKVEIKDVRDTPWSGAQHGVALYAYNEDEAPRTLVVTNNNIHDFQKNGMALNGTGLTVSVTGNVVVGYGPTDKIAQNCIQVGFGASGTVSGNTVSDVSWLGEEWTAAAILILYSNADVTNNSVTDGQTGIYFWDGSGTISGNAIFGSDTGIGREDFYGIIAGDPPTALPSPLDEGSLGAAQVRAMAELTIAIAINDNTITGSGGESSEGLEIAAGYEDDDVSLTATGNTITGWGYGVAVYKCTSDCGAGTFTSLTLHQNSISDNSSYGMYVEGMTTDVDAEFNWWGHVSGPNDPQDEPGETTEVPPCDTVSGDAMMNVDGTGDKVHGPVDYCPWLNTPGGVSIGSGDVNGDGKTKVDDVRIVLQAVLGLITLDSAQQAAADVDGDGDVDMDDVICIAEWLIGIPCP